MKSADNRVCPVELAGSLDFFLRRWLQNPSRILSPFVKAGMTVMDYGCGPGFFTVDMARLVGPTGRLIAVDLQAGMLAKLKRKIQGTELATRITLHRCSADRIGLSERVDFALAFYVVHEIVDQETFFRQLAALLAPDGRVLVVEPPVHVSRSDFRNTIQAAQNAGCIPEPGPRMLLSKSIVLRKS